MKLRAALRKGGRGGDVARTRTRTTTNTTTTSSSSSSSSAGEAVLDNINNNEPKNDSDDSQKTTKVTSLLLRRIRRTRHVSLGGLIAMIMLMGTLIALSVPTSLSLSSSGQQQQQRQQQVHNNNKVDDSNFQTLTSIPKNQNLNCSHILSIVTTNLPPPRQQSEWRKPLWVPSFAGSGSAGPSGKGDIVKGLINAVTGLSGGSKNYHASIRNGKLKRCYGISETTSCSMGHPMVSVQPEQQTKNFQSEVILVVRNFLTAFPASHIDKHIAYHNGKGQPPEENWRNVRDEYLESSIKSWRHMINYWMNVGGGNDGEDDGSSTIGPYYKVGLILPYEWMLDPIRGPMLIQQLADLYQRVGFDVLLPLRTNATSSSSSSEPTHDEVIYCIWNQMSTKENKRQEELVSAYKPGYTKSQQDLMIHHMEEGWKEYQNDPVLKILFQEYKDQIVKEIRIEE